MPYCTYCGSELRATDKFCIYCGKPHIIKSSDTAKEKASPPPQPKQEPFSQPKESSKQKANGKSKEKGANKGEKEPVTFEKGAEAEDESAGTKTPSKGKAGKKGKVQGPAAGEAEVAAAAVGAAGAEGAEEEGTATGAGGAEEEGAAEESTQKVPVAELPDDVKEQVEIRMEIEMLASKKKKIAEKVAETSKLLDDPQFEIDKAFHNDVNAKIAAIKQIKGEYDAQEEELKGRLDPAFPLVALATRIEVLKTQIEELKNNFKLHRVERDVFDQLNGEYTDELTQDIETYGNLLAALKVWLTKLKAEKHERNRDINLAKARLRSKEITKEQCDEKLAELNLQLEKLDDKITVVNEFLAKK
ncbi:MAG TPA: zinc-ribbon domain-containing protein [Candidatus Lokiarchaeia archaeon]|nr:zinc-ribbon domain-containing protein [Candidatus Lokiarchaeia archaeon]